MAASALPITAGVPLRTAAAPPAWPSNPVRLYKAIFDDRYAESLAFAEHAHRFGVVTHGIRGDITDLWYYDLHLRWRNGPAAIAGLTAINSLFCLEQLAWDHRMRVVFRAEHKRLPDGRIEHELSGPESLLQRAPDLNSGGEDWGRGIAGLVTRCPEGRCQAAKATIITPSAGTADDLVSWVIAPVRRG